MLQQIAHWNDLSPKLRKEIEDKVHGLGRYVSFRFNISHENPDPEKYNGDIVWPQMYTLDPITFRITDPYEDREGKSKSKQIGMVDQVDDKGTPTSFHRVRVFSRHKGKLIFDLEKIDEQMFVMYLLVHPKLTNGKFLDKNAKQMVSLIDEKKEAAEGRKIRNERRQAYDAIQHMSEKELRDFAAAMLWDEHDDLDILKDKAETFSETNFEMFKDIVEGKTIEFRSTVKRALDSRVISFNPAEQKFMWVSNQKTITVLGANTENKSEVERLSEWLMTNGEKSDEIYKKIKSLTKV